MRVTIIALALGLVLGFLAGVYFQRRIFVQMWRAEIDRRVEEKRQGRSSTRPPFPRPVELESKGDEEDSKTSEDPLP